VNLKYTLGPNVTLDAAINPDYAEIEADAPVVHREPAVPDLLPGEAALLSRGKRDLRILAPAFLFTHDRRSGLRSKAGLARLARIRLVFLSHPTTPPGITPRMSAAIR
jgi:hypothetical protein